MQTGNAGKAVAVDRNLLAAMYYINVVPDLEAGGDGAIRFRVGLLQMFQGLPRKHHAPTERVIRAIAFEHGDVMGGAGMLH